MGVLTAVRVIKVDDYIYELLEDEGLITHVHINNTKTNRNSVTVPVHALQELIKDLTLIDE